MAAPKIPYPPSPKDVPEDLTDYPASYRSKQNVLLIGLFIFLLFYFGLIALCVLLGTYCAVTLHQYPPLKVFGIVFCGISFLFLVKGFFKRHPEEKELRLEITEEEQPILFGFIYQLCEELDAPEPNRVFVSTDVNAAVMPRSSLINLFKEPKKDLLIGLGLVNCVNLSEFKSVMAHEFGHFCQSGYISSYSYVASMIIIDIIVGEDFLDRFIEWCKRQQNAMSIIGYGIGIPLWIGKKCLELAFKAITLQRLAVLREQEFHADLVAVKAAGSDAVGLSLMRLRFGNLCLMQAMNDLSLAAEHKLYSRDLFFHQDRAEPTVRRNRKEPELGVRPESDDPMAGKRIRVFDPDKEEEEHDEIPEMRRTHPPAHETEENAKATFIPAVVDHRSPWILFTDLADLKERLTYKFYRMSFRVKKSVELVEAQEVQQFIDDEHAETTYDPKYKGVYDFRPLEPGDVGELNQIVRDSPWDDDRIEKVMEKLYEDAGNKAEDYEELRKDKATLENTPDKPSPRMKKKIKKIQKEMDKLWDWFKSLDRRVYLCHVQMGAAVNKDWRDELVERYRFGMEIQRLFTESQHHSERAFLYARVLFNNENLHPEFVAEIFQILREAWRALKKIVQDARDINMPALKNFEEGERLADFILDGKMVSEPPLSYVKANWAQKLVDQLRGVRRRTFRLHWKSVGGILALQEKIAEAWKQKRAPVEAAVVAETIDAIPAEVVHAEPVDAEPVDALPAEVMQAEILAAEEVHPEVIDVPAVEVVDAAVVHAAEILEGEALEPEPPSAPVADATVSPAPEPPPEPVPEPVPEPEHVFLLPGDPEPAKTPVADATGSPAPELPPPTDADFFSLNTDAPEPEPVVLPPVPTPAVAASAPQEDFFSLDLDAHKPAPAEAPAFVPTPVLGETITKPAKNGRPPMKITYVRPGEKSPLAK